MFAGFFLSLNGFNGARTFPVARENNTRHFRGMVSFKHPAPNDHFERNIGGVIAGVDEVGRGCLAGPVYAAAVILPPALLSADIGLRDSKQISKLKREALAQRLQQEAYTGIGFASVAEIDDINILQAALLAMARAVAALPMVPDHCLVDGNKAPPIRLPATCIIKGDQKSRSIAAASIVAKTARDAKMQQLHAAHPHYGWDTNAGYGTQVHRDALALVGPSPHHRMSFKPLRQ